jgi:hypothetical protein
MFASFLGVLIGVIVSNIAVEEISHASVYLKYLNTILVPTIVGIATYNISKLNSIIFAGITLIVLTIFRKRYNDAWTYSCMGAILYVSTLSNETLKVAVLVFVYGMSVATISASIHFKKKINERINFSENLSLIKKILGRYSYYLLVGMMFYVTFSYIL